MDEIFSAFPREISREKGWTYVEPFVGGGAVLFRVLRAFPNLSRAVVCDINPALAETYRCVKNRARELVDELSALEREFFALPETGDARREFFIERRAEFNALSAQSCGNAAAREPDVRIPALLIFLNRTCFNGLYRVNSRGEFNVPFGKYRKPKICDEETLFADSELLRNTEIFCGDFEKTLKYANGGKALFYLDPPYKPVSATSAFTSYAKENFGDAEQERLREFCGKLHARGARFVLSNSDARDAAGTSYFEKLYAGFDFRRVLATRAVNADPAKRGRLSEMLISNCQKKGLRHGRNFG